MALLTHDIEKSISAHGFAEIEGERMRLGWPAPSKPEDPSVEERVHRWADLNGWVCNHDAQRDVYVLRRKV
jgi:hypothetical protein